MKKNLFGIYVHIPYCLQRCTYCDFATYVHTEIKPPEYYVDKLKKEIINKKNIFKPQQIDTLYFGGGTPSLISAELIVDIISTLELAGFKKNSETEITIEINPATVDEKKLETYLKAGINRFSVGAQSFSNRLLKMVNREHNADQTIQTLDLLKKYNLNFSFDVLFALPTQTLAELKNDVQIAVQLGSKHISPYCLTVPEGHPLSKNRPLDEEQIEMFNIIHTELTNNNFSRYEISNYALPGFESRHNLLYWTDAEFWGLGLSAHSYSKSSPWGSRFWNVNSFDLYCQQMTNETEFLSLTDHQPQQLENLEKHQALTDFCYTSLRLSTGLPVDKLVEKFGKATADLVVRITQPLIEKSFLRAENKHYVLTESGIILSNQIFEKFTFLKEDIV